MMLPMPGTRLAHDGGGGGDDGDGDGDGSDDDNDDDGRVVISCTFSYMEPSRYRAVLPLLETMVRLDAVAFSNTNVVPLALGWVANHDKG
jgi:hypothetical protein